MYALDASTGVKLWSHFTKGGVYSSPAVVNGIVYIGSDSVYALDAKTGARSWKYTTGSGFDSSPAVVNGVVYIGSDDDNVSALDAKTGAKLWSYTTGNTIFSSPAVANERGGLYRLTGPQRVCFGCQDGSQTVELPHGVWQFLARGSQWSGLHWLVGRQRVCIPFAWNAALSFLPKRQRLNDWS